MMINSGRCNVILFPLNSLPPGFNFFVKLESFSPATAHRCATTKVGGQPVGESCRYLVGKFLGRQIGELLGCWSVGECVGWVAEVFLHPGQLQDQHRQGDQTHKRTLTF